MSFDSLPQVSLGTAALIIFATCVAFAFLRGLLRLAFFSCVLLASSWIAHRVWIAAPQESLVWFGEPLNRYPYALPIIVWLVSFFLLHRVGKICLAPFGKKDTSSSSWTLGKILASLCLAVIPTAVLLLLGAIFIHSFGSVEEIRDYSSKQGNAKHSEEPKWLQQMKKSVVETIPEEWLNVLDPVSDPMRIALVKFISSDAQGKFHEEKDPATGQPIPRAILIDDEELETLALEGKFDSLLRHPFVIELSKDPKIRQWLETHQP